MNTQIHRIRKQVVEVRLIKKEGAYQIQNQLSLLYNTQAVKMFDTLFSEVSAPDEYLVLDRLEIDLGRISLKNLEGEFLCALKKQMQEVLLQKVGNFHREATGQKPISSKERNAGGLSQFQVFPEKQRVTSREYKRELLRYFLRTGTLPWWADSASVDMERIFIEFLETFPEEREVFLREALAHEHVRRRLVYQFSESVLFRIVEAGIPSIAAQIKILIEELIKVYEPLIPYALSKFEYLFMVWNAVFTSIFVHTDELKLEREIIQRTITQTRKAIRRREEEVVAVIQEYMEKLERRKFILKSRLPQIINMLFQKATEEETVRKNRDVYTAKEKRREGSLNEKETVPAGISQKEMRKGQEAELAIQEEERSKQILLGSKEKPGKSVPDEEGGERGFTVKEVTVENGGLILLWPYLGRFFSTLGILIDGRFADTEAHMRAVYLLHYLVTGKEDAQEFQLSLNKLLCDLDISYPVYCEGKMSEREKEECTVVITAAIKNWSALKNTSVEGFRGSFLQRKGILEEKQKHWLLRVERKAYDMLLEKLPWSISVIKLSWMKKALYVEW